VSCAVQTRSTGACGDFLQSGARSQAAQVVTFIDQNKDEVVDGRRLEVGFIRCERYP